MENILKKALKVGEHAEVFQLSGSSTQVNFENGRLKKINSSENFGTALRIIRGGKIGFATTTRQNDVDDLVRRAMDVVEFGGECRFELPSEECGEDVKSVPLFSERTADTPTEKMVESGLEIIRRIHGYERQIQVFCGFTVGQTKVATANSAGLKCEYKKTGAGFGVGGRLIEGKNMLTCFESRAGINFDFDIQGLTEKVIEDFDVARKNVPAASGEYPVILTPHAASDLLMPIIVCSNGRAVAKGISPWRGRLGEEMFDPRLTIYDDGLLENGTATAHFDDEGVAMQRTAVIEKGVLKNFIHDLDSAAALGARPTGNGLRNKRMGNIKDVAAPPAPSSTNVVMEPGDMAVDEMLKNMGDGILVDRLIGTMMGNLYGGVVGGNILLGYKVEGGKRVGRIKDAMMSVNAFSALKDNLVALSRERIQLGSFVLPYVRLKNVNIATRE
jgi:PmbA protein